MTTIILQDPSALWWLLGAAGLLLVGLAGLWRQERARKRFFDSADGRSWTRSTVRGRRVASVALSAVGLGCLAFALARPSTDPQPQRVQRVGRDVMFVLDVSRSMLAQDIRPNRLERAKLGVRDAIDAAEGDRIGLIAFAGTAVLKSPLTSDYAFLRMALDDTTPTTVGRGGTAIGDAIRAAVGVLIPESDAAPNRDPDRVQTDRSKTIVLITDGEDHETNPMNAAKLAAEKGIRIVTIGVGSELTGAPVPGAPLMNSRGELVEQRSAMVHDGRQVLSRMDPAVLRQVAEATPGGMFINAGTGNIDMDTLYRRLLQTSGPKIEEQTTTVRYTELFQIVLALAVAILCVEVLLHARYK